jgi:hypothetical protein
MITVPSLVLDISSADLAPISLLLSVFALILSLLYQRSTTRNSMLSQVFENLFSDETRKMRFRVREWRDEFLRIKDEPGYALPNSVETAGKYVASVYDRVGFFLMRNNRLTEDFLNWQGDTVLEMWDIIGDWVTKRWRGENLIAIRYRHPKATREMVSAAYSNYFEWLGRKAMDRETHLFSQTSKERFD